MTERFFFLSKLFAVCAVTATVAQNAYAAPRGEVVVMAPPLLRRAAVEVDGEAQGALPQKQRLELAPGPHKLTIAQGRFRLSAEVTVRAGQRAQVRWPKPGLGKVTYSPTLVLVMEPSDANADLKAAAVDSVHREGLDVLGEAGIPVETVRPSACSEAPACLEEQAQAHGLRHVLAVSAGSDKGGQMLAVRLFDGETGDVAAQRHEDCPGCTVEQKRARLYILCTDVLERGLHRPLGLLEVTSQPPGAEVLVDGRRVGTTPYRRSAGPGEHEVVVHKTGYLDYQNTVDVVTNRGSVLDAMLKKDEPPPPPPPPPPPTSQRHTSKRS